MSEALKVNNSTIRLVQGDITMLEVEAFVFYASHDLQLGSGFGTAVALRGGPSIQEELNGRGPLRTTDVTVSTAGKLKAAHIIHAVGPRFREKDLEGKLRKTVLNCLKQAEQLGLRTIALPAMGTGFYGVPLPTCAAVSLRAVNDYLSNRTGIEDVVFCLLDAREYEVFRERLTDVPSARASA